MQNSVCKPLANICRRPPPPATKIGNNWETIYNIWISLRHDILHMNYCQILLTNTNIICTSQENIFPYLFLIYCRSRLRTSNVFTRLYVYNTNVFLQAPLPTGRPCIAKCNSFRMNGCRLEISNAHNFWHFLRLVSNFLSDFSEQKQQMTNKAHMSRQNVKWIVWNIYKIFPQIEQFMCMEMF